MGYRWYSVLGVEANPVGVRSEMSRHHGWWWGRWLGGRLLETRSPGEFEKPLH